MSYTHSVRHRCVVHVGWDVGRLAIIIDCPLYASLELTPPANACFQTVICIRHRRSQKLEMGGGRRLCSVTVGRHVGLAIVSSLVRLPVGSLSSASWWLVLV